MSKPIAFHVSLEYLLVWWCDTYVGLGSVVCAAMDIQMSLLHEALVAAGTITDPFLLGLVVGRSGS